MTTQLPAEKRYTFRDIDPLKFRDVQATIAPGCRLVHVFSENQNGPDGDTVMLDMAEAIALKDWLTQVLT